MGKLHKIRRAIERKPDAWGDIPRYTVNDKTTVPGAKLTCHVDRLTWRTTHQSSYRRFVYRVMQDLGHDVHIV